MRLRAMVLSLLAIGVASCSGNDTPKDSGVDTPTIDLISKKEAGKLDQSKVDANPATLPKIKSILPDSGFADKKTPVVLIGENFVQGMAVYIDGFPIHDTVNVQSSANASFPMPRHPEVGDPKPYTVHVRVLVKTMQSNDIKFRYILPTKMTSGLHGVITTKSVDAITYIASPVIEGKVTVAPPDAGVGNEPEAEIGYGPVGTNPSVDGAWRWLPAPKLRTEGAYTVFGASARFPTEGSFDLAMRFSADGGEYWIFADTDDADLAYSTGQAAKLKVNKPPYDGYCLATEDCAAFPIRSLCNTTKKLCVECMADNDCTANPYSYGPKCDVGNAACVCAVDADCAKNPNGAKCNSAVKDVRPFKYCGCNPDQKNCIAPKDCKENPPQSGFFICS